MKTTKPIYTRLILAFLLLISINITAQTTIIGGDSIKIKPIPISRIPSRMAQTRIKTLKIQDNMVSYEQLSTHNTNNDSIIAEVRNKVQNILNSSKENLSLRNLDNNKRQLKLMNDEIRDQVNTLSAYINKLDNNDEYLKGERIIWTITEKDLIEKNYSSTTLQRIFSIDSLISNTRQEISQRTEMIFLALELCTKTVVDIDESIATLNTLGFDLEQNITSDKHPSIFNLNYTKENTVFISPLKKYTKETINDLKTYLEFQITSLIVTIFLFFLLLYLFFVKKSFIKKWREDSSNYYQQKLGLILQSPLNAAVILTLAFTTLTFQDKPLGFRDLTSYIFLIPLIIVTKQLLRKELHRHITVFFFLMISVALFSVFPTDNVFFRANLLILSILEGGIIGHLLKLQIDRKQKGEATRPYLNAILFVYLSFSCIGLIGAIFGQIQVAQILLKTTYMSIFSAAILYASTMMTNGLVISFLEGKLAQKINAIANYNFIIKKRFVNVINTLAIYYWIVLFLRQLKIWSPIYEQISAFLHYEWQVGALMINVGNIFVFFIVIYLSTFLSRIIQVVLEGDVLNKMNLAKGLPHTISVSIKYTLITLGVIFAVSVVGIDFSSLTVIFGAIGVGIGFGLQTIFNNLVSGFILLFERPVQIGDTVEIGTLIGKVTSIGIRASNVRTIEGAEVVVPNSRLVENELINWTLSDQKRRIEVLVGVSYDSDPEHVKELLESTMLDHPLIMQDPKPSVFFINMGDSSLDFRMLFWTGSYSEWYKIKSEVMTRAFQILKENNIVIPFPQRDIHIIDKSASKE